MTKIPLLFVVILTPIFVLPIVG